MDKTLLIKEVIDLWASVILLPRPRRFGKTLNLTTLRYFFEKHPEQEADNRHLFQNLAIFKEDKKYRDHLGKHPVIYLTFKDVKEETWNDANEAIGHVIRDEFLRHRYL